MNGTPAIEEIDIDESPVKYATELVCQQQLPRLIGRLDYRQESIRMAFSCAGMRTECLCAFLFCALTS